VDWNKRINAAINSIENNLESKLDINAAAKSACSSSFHFQRMFNAILGVTPAEYARRRKLSEAAKELTSEKVKVMEVASKYGFESPNAFTRAFRNTFDINPCEARASKAKLPVFSRESCRIDIKGNSTMNYKIIKKPAFEIIGKSKLFDFDKFMKEAPKFWKKYVATKEYESLYSLNNGRCGKVSQAPLMSVYIPDKNGSRSTFTDVLAIENDSDSVISGLESFKIPVATYAEFDCTYNTSAKMNKYIYGEWFSKTGYERDGNKPDIAAYFPVAFRPLKDMRVRWWVPIIESYAA